MLRNYFLIGLRLLRKNKLFSMINVFGLSTGIACCILITLYVQDEFNFEKGIDDADKIFRINTTFIKDGEVQKGPGTSPPIAVDLAAALPEIELATRAMSPPGVEQHIVRYKDKVLFEKEAILVDSTFFDVFPFEFEEGDPRTALDDPSTVVLSYKLAKKLFSEGRALDEVIIVNSGTNADTFRITGVLEKPTYPSHLDADLYLSMRSNGWGEWALAQTTWANNNMMGSYLKLKDPSRYQELESKFPDFVERYAGEELRSSGRQKILTLQPLDKIRLYSDMGSRQRGNPESSITYILIILTIGALVLLLACINFMNLTTAKSSQRAGEVGIRKSMGAHRSNLIRQFLGESSVIVALALLVAFAIVIIVLPVFNNLMQKELSLNASNAPLIIGAALVICVFTAIISGSYPAFYLSSLKPTQVLKGKSLTIDASQWLRKSLVVFQFVITITLISSIVIIQKQMSFIRAKKLGFEVEQVVMVPMRSQNASGQFTTLKNGFEQVPGVNAVSATSSLPSTPLFRDWGVFREGWSNEQSLRHEIVSVDQDYFETLKIPFLAGRDFVAGQDNLESDTINPPKVIVNEASLNALQIPLENALGQLIYFQPGTERLSFTIVGVVKNFHQFSLHREISPMMFIMPGNRNYFSYMALSIDMKSYQQIKPELEALWQERIDDVPFETVFLSDNVAKLYEAEKRTSDMLSISTIIALIISALGLYGLSVYIAERRVKEIGIRKVVGASVYSIVSLLSKQYIKLIVMAFILAIPIGYYLMDKWLQGFAYRMELGVSVFLVSGGISILLAWLTISFESFKAANKNPVDTFRVN